MTSGNALSFFMPLNLSHTSMHSKVELPVPEEEKNKSRTIVFADENGGVLEETREYSVDPLYDHNEDMEFVSFQSFGEDSDSDFDSDDEYWDPDRAARFYVASQQGRTDSGAAPDSDDTDVARSALTENSGLDTVEPTIERRNGDSSFTGQSQQVQTTEKTGRAEKTAYRWSSSQVVVDEFQLSLNRLKILKKVDYERPDYYLGGCKPVVERKKMKVRRSWLAEDKTSPPVRDMPPSKPRTRWRREESPEQSGKKEASNAEESKVSSRNIRKPRPKGCIRKAKFYFGLHYNVRVKQAPEEFGLPENDEVVRQNEALETNQSVAVTESEIPSKSQTSFHSEPSVSELPNREESSLSTANSITESSNTLQSTLFGGILRQSSDNFSSEASESTASLDLDDDLESSSDESDSNNNIASPLNDENVFDARAQTQRLSMQNGSKRRANKELQTQRDSLSQLPAGIRTDTSVSDTMKKESQRGLETQFHTHRDSLPQLPASIRSKNATSANIQRKDIKQGVELQSHTQRDSLPKLPPSKRPNASTHTTPPTTEKASERRVDTGFHTEEDSPMQVSSSIRPNTSETTTTRKERKRGVDIQLQYSLPSLPSRSRPNASRSPSPIKPPEFQPPKQRHSSRLPATLPLSDHSRPRASIPSAEALGYEDTSLDSDGIKDVHVAPPVSESNPLDTPLKKPTRRPTKRSKAPSTKKQQKKTTLGRVEEGQDGRQDSSNKASKSNQRTTSTEDSTTRTARSIDSQAETSSSRLDDSVNSLLSESSAPAVLDIKRGTRDKLSASEIVQMSKKNSRRRASLPTGTVSPKGKTKKVTGIQLKRKKTTLPSLLRPRGSTKSSLNSSTGPGSRRKKNKETKKDAKILSPIRKKKQRRRTSLPLLNPLETQQSESTVEKQPQTAQPTRKKKQRRRSSLPNTSSHGEETPSTEVEKKKPEKSHEKKRGQHSSAHELHSSAVTKSPHTREKESHTKRRNGKHRSHTDPLSKTIGSERTRSRRKHQSQPDLLSKSGVTERTRSRSGILPQSDHLSKAIANERTGSRRKHHSQTDQLSKTTNERIRTRSEQLPQSEQLSSSMAGERRRRGSKQEPQTDQLSKTTTERIRTRSEQLPQSDQLSSSMAGERSRRGSKQEPQTDQLSKTTTERIRTRSEQLPQSDQLSSSMAGERSRRGSKQQPQSDQLSNSVTIEETKSRSEERQQTDQLSKSMASERKRSRTSRRPSLPLLQSQLSDPSLSICDSVSRFEAEPSNTRIGDLPESIELKGVTMPTRQASFSSDSEQSLKASLRNYVPQLESRGSALEVSTTANDVDDARMDGSETSLSRQLKRLGGLAAPSWSKSSTPKATSAARSKKSTEERPGRRFFRMKSPKGNNAEEPEATPFEVKEQPNDKRGLFNFFARKKNFSMDDTRQRPKFSLRRGKQQRSENVESEMTKDTKDSSLSSFNEDVLPESEQKGKRGGGKKAKKGRIRRTMSLEAFPLKLGKRFEQKKKEKPIRRTNSLEHPSDKKNSVSLVKNPSVGKKSEQDKKAKPIRKSKSLEHPSNKENSSLSLVKNQSQIRREDSAVGMLKSCSATKIQAVIRGFKARRETQRLRDTERQERRDKAASVIQALVRGFLDRIFVEAFKPFGVKYKGKFELIQRRKRGELQSIADNSMRQKREFHPRVEELQQESKRLKVGICRERLDGTKMKQSMVSLRESIEHLSKSNLSIYSAMDAATEKLRPHEERNEQLEDSLRKLEEELQGVKDEMSDAKEEFFKLRRKKDRFHRCLDEIMEQVKIRNEDDDKLYERLFKRIAILNIKLAERGIVDKKSKDDFDFF